MRYWYVRDGRGNVIALTGPKGSVVASYADDPWGQVISSTETIWQPFRYGSYWYNADLGVYWLQVRSYDPTLKRFLQPDPAAIDGTRSYVHVGDDPVDGTDPLGADCSWFLVGGIS